MISQLSMIKKKEIRTKAVTFSCPPFLLNLCIVFFLSFFLFIFNVKSSDSSFEVKAVNLCRNIGQDVSSDLPHLVFKL